MWIPAEILLNNDLSDKEKIVLSMVLYLSDATGSCFASNKYIASIVNVTSDRVSKIVSSLKDKGYVDVNLKYKIDTKEIEERQIIPITESINRYSEKYLEGIGKNNYSGRQKEPHPIGENDKGIINNIKNKNYSNENIDKEKSYLNYSLKSPQYSYEKEFDKIKEKYNLKGQIKTVSNIACEYIITSDYDFFERIGEEETKRFFETAYKFVVEYKNLGEQYILSAKVHRDEQTPHMHLIFLSVVHTIDKKGNSIDKLACSEFWKAKDSYRQLQDAFYKYMVENEFNLQRGLPKEENNRQHYSVEEYKKITNFKETKKVLKNMKLELPDVPDITDININRLSKKRDEKILKEIIKPKDNVIQNLYQDNINLHKELTKQTKIVEEAEKYQKERDLIIADNEELHKQVDSIKVEYKEKEFDIEWKYKSKIKGLERENNHLHKIVDKFYETVEKFINWICQKFGIGESKELVREFEKETNMYIDPEKQLKKEERAKEWDLEI